MNFLLADTFADSLTRLTTQEQKSVKTSVFDLQIDPSQRTYAEKSYNGPARITGSAGTGKTIASLIRHVSDKIDGHSFSENFLISEWKHVIDAWQIATLDDYLSVPRTGRKTRLGARQREPLWEIMAGVKSVLAEAFASISSYSSDCESMLPSTSA